MHCAWFMASLLISWFDVMKPKYIVYNNIQFNFSLNYMYVLKAYLYGSLPNCVIYTYMYVHVHVAQLEDDLEGAKEELSTVQQEQLSMFWTLSIV